MKRTTLWALILASTLLSANAHAEWWQKDWKYRKPIAVDTTPQAGNITDNVGRMPVLVRLHTGNFSFDGTQEHGNDLRFIASDDKTPLNYQIESFDPLLGIAYIWVDVPSVAGSQRQDFWLYYGNDKAPSVSSGQRAFDPDYDLIYHFDTAGAPPQDVTAYANNAKNAPATIVDGVIGKAVTIGNAPIVVAASPSLAVNAGGAFSFSAWIKQEQSSGDQLIYARRDSGHAFLVGLSNGSPFVEIDGQRSAPLPPLPPAAWQHLAVTAAGGQVVLYVNGHADARVGSELPALNSATVFGGDVPNSAASATAVTGAGSSSLVSTNEAAQPAPAAASSYANFAGAIDEVRVSKITRPAALLLADAVSQGAESKLVAYGPDEKASGLGFGTLGFVIKAVPFDAWIIIIILALMAVHSWWVMFSKHRYINRLSDANEDFDDAFGKIGTRLEALADDTALSGRLQESSLWRLYQVAVLELRARRSQGADAGTISAATIEAIRVSMDAARTHENHRLGARLGGLSNAIAGGPYIGLLGTVIGIMLVFGTAAMAGDVNINSVAPGMAAALLATAMGLVVAIPALFGYNYLVGRNKSTIADMRVFVDKFVARLAELHGQKN